jgi:hypothetical protein
MLNVYCTYTDVLLILRWLARRFYYHRIKRWNAQLRSSYGRLFLTSSPEARTVCCHSSRCTGLFMNLEMHNVNIESYRNQCLWYVLSIYGRLFLASNPEARTVCCHSSRCTGLFMYSEMQ